MLRCMRYWKLLISPLCGEGRRGGRGEEGSEGREKGEEGGGQREGGISRREKLI